MMQLQDLSTEGESGENKTEECSFSNVCCLGRGICLSLYFFIPENIMVIKPIKIRKDKNVPPSPTALNIQLPTIPTNAKLSSNISITTKHHPIPFKDFIILSQYSITKFPTIILIRGNPIRINST